MTWTAGIAIFLVIWWTVLFAVLPWGIISQHEVGGVREGADAGAPVRPMLVRKALVTTLIAAVLWAGTAYIIVYRPIGFDDIPFMPKFREWPAGADTVSPHENP
jgi:predicted secreted protein